MSSIFRYTPLSYFQLPDDVVESGKWGQLKPSAQSLYILLLHLAQRRSSETVTITAEDASKVGISVNSLKAARDQLVRNKLVAALKSNGYSYRILDPTTGAPLERVEDLTAVAPEVVQSYFLAHLEPYDPVDQVTGLQSRCPFRAHKDRLRPLHVTFTDGGAFKCHHCDAEGGILDFEIAMAAKDGDKVTKNMAHARVRGKLVKASRELSRHKRRAASSI